jgi:hypothetical protein
MAPRKLFYTDLDDEINKKNRRIIRRQDLVIVVEESVPNTLGCVCMYEAPEKSLDATDRATNSCSQRGDYVGHVLILVLFHPYVDKSINQNPSESSTK